MKILIADGEKNVFYASQQINTIQQSVVIAITYLYTTKMSRRAS